MIERIMTISLSIIPRVIGQTNLRQIVSVTLVAPILLSAVSSANAFEPLFRTRLDYTVGSAPIFVVHCDINGDGLPELISANTSNSSVSLLVNQGNGTFVRAQDIAVGSDPSWLTAVDVENDGDMDLAIANQGSNNVTIVKNMGGVLVADSTYGVGAGPLSIISADLDIDGDSDLAVTNIFANTIQLLNNRGDGLFDTLPSIAAGLGPRSICVGDMNNDLRPDLIVADYYGASVTILQNTGDLSFGDPITIACGTNPHAVGVGDFDKDGDLDVAAAIQYGPVLVYWNMGSGNFSVPTSYSVGGGPVTIFVKDIDLDSNLDLLIANNYSSSATILFGSSNGAFESGLSIPLNTNPHSVRAVDVNGDGYPDLVSDSFLGCGSGQVSVILNKTGRIFELPDHIDIEGASSITSGDLNHDGYPEIVVGCSNRDMRVFRNNGNGEFVYGGDFDAGRTPTSILIANLYGPNSADIVTANYDSTTVSILRNNGDGTFGPRVVYEVGNNPSSVAARDIDGDGFLDLVVAVYGDDQIQIFRNLGNGILEPWTTIICGTNYSGMPWFVSAGDLNGDSLPDIVLTFAHHTGVTVYFGWGGKSFGDRSNVPLGSDYYQSPSGLWVGDFDSDGKAEIVANEAGYSAVAKFTTGVSFAVDTFQHTCAGDLSIGDFDADGHKDIITSSNSVASLSFQKSDVAEFAGSSATRVGTTSYIRQMTNNDFDLDGRLDIAGIDVTSNEVIVLRNIYSAQNCCRSTTGNVDCDPVDIVDIGDLSALIDNLYITFAPLCCVKEANVDGQAGIDISDLAALIDYLYISFTPPAACQ